MSTKSSEGQFQPPSLCGHCDNLPTYPWGDGRNQAYEPPPAWARVPEHSASDRMSSRRARKIVDARRRSLHPDGPRCGRHRSGDLDRAPDGAGCDRVFIVVEAHQARLGDRRRLRVESVEPTGLGNELGPFGFEHIPDRLISQALSDPVPISRTTS